MNNLIDYWYQKYLKEKEKNGGREMKTPRCTKCKYFHKSRAKRRIYDHGQGYSEVSPSLADSLATYLCHKRWWCISSLKSIPNGDVCEDFKFKTNKIKEDKK